MAVVKQESLTQLRTSFSTCKALAIDTETTISGTFHERRIIGISLALLTTSDAVETFYIPVGHGFYMETMDPENVELPRDFFKEVPKNIPVIFHNAKFDYHALNQVVDIEYLQHELYDTMLMGHLIDENQFVALDKMGEKYLGERKEKALAKVMASVDWDCIPPGIMARYAEQDAALTLRLYQRLLPEFQQYEEIWSYDRQFLFLLYKMEERGLPIDQKYCLQQSAACGRRMKEILDELQFDPAKPSQLHKVLFSPVPDGLELTPSSFTPTGKPQVNDEFLEKNPHPVCVLVSEYRKLGKARASYFDAYLRHADSAGRMHATFKQQGTLTGRLSCADPNLQQIPREGNVKKAFLPEKGRQLWEIDYSQVEYRLAAVYSRDNDLIAQLEDGASYHDIIAAKLGITRQTAKTVNFLILYGGGVKKLADFLKIDIRKADKIVKDYKAEVPALFRAKDQATEAARNTNSVRLWSGRRRHFEWESEHHKAFNSVIQGGAFEIVKRAMLRLDEAGFDVRNQVHDSVWLMVDSEEEVKRAAEIMSLWTKELFGATFFVDYKRLN